jgi:hypothetical protein
MLDKVALLKIWLLILFLMTVVVIWSFAIYTSQNNVGSTSEVIYIQSSRVVKSSSSKAIASSFISSNSSSLYSSISSDQSSSSSESGSSSSLVFPILDNNIDLIDGIDLIIEKPNPEIQAQIKAAKNRPKVETKSSISQSISSTPE